MITSVFILHRILSNPSNTCLQDDEARRNSMMPDMLFIALSHKLSPYIFSLASRCKQLSNNDRIEVKEKIDPFARFVLQCYSCILLFSFSSLIQFMVCAVVGWMATYPFVLEFHALQFSDHQFKRWMISWTIKSCKLQTIKFITLYYSFNKLWHI